MNLDVSRAFDGWFLQPGAYVLVDGQYGRSGKGLVAGALAECFWELIDIAISNNGPNSGHTSYLHGKKIVLKQLPTFSVVARHVSKLQDEMHTFLSAGAVIDPFILRKEVKEHSINKISVHPHAAVISIQDKEKDRATVSGIASTGQGVGPATERKISRLDPKAVWGGGIGTPGVNAHLFNHMTVCFMEIPQGFSLGINSGFYPHVTSRE